MELIRMAGLFVLVLCALVLLSCVDEKAKARDRVAFGEAYALARAHYDLCGLAWPPGSKPIVTDNSVNLAVGGDGSFLGGRGGDAVNRPPRGVEQAKQDLQRAAYREAARLGIPPPQIINVVSHKEAILPDDSVEKSRLWYEARIKVWNEYAAWFRAAPKKVL